MSRLLLHSVLLAGFVLSARPVLAQADSTEAPRPDRRAVSWEDSLDQVVVTATQSVRALENVPVPTIVVSARQIDARGTLRLGDLLAEIPGLTVVEGVGGEGLQMQGFDSDYTLILIDGEPVIGRTAGTLDLDRLSVTQVERVEVVRGPLSARYGADALAGVVNVITRRPQGAMRGEAAAQVRSLGTSQVSVSGEAGGDFADGFSEWGVRSSVTRYGSDGYSAKPETGVLTVPAFSDYAADVRARAAIQDRTTVDVTGRLSRETQDGRFILGEDLFNEHSERTDGSLAVSATHRLSDRLTAEASLYGARFANSSRTETLADSLFDATNFDQDYGKAEGSVTWLASNQVAVYGGGGVIGERVSGERYTETKTARQPYATTEVQWMPGGWLPTGLLDVTASLRFDAPSDYASRLTPRVAALVRPLSWLRVRASVGSGYKAPAFRQRYLAFTNAAGGYSVYGAAVARETLADLDEAGGLDRHLVEPERLGALRAESSTAVGLGVEVQPLSNLTVRANVFHNEVTDLIDTQPVAIRAGGQQVFSYFNLNEVYTRGVEAEVHWRTMLGGSGTDLGTLDLTAGLQLLETADRDVLRAIEAGTLFQRTESGRDVRIRRSAYGGLFGRSRHSGSLSLLHGLRRWGLTTSARLTWRGRYGFADENGSGVLDADGEYAPGYAAIDLTVSKEIGPGALQAGVDNLTNQTNAKARPGQLGRAFFLGGRVCF